MSRWIGFDAEWSSRMDFIKARTDEHLEWLQTPHRPAAGSPLFGDDKLYPRRSTSLMAWQGMVSATDHLSLMFEALLRGTRPISQFTLARASLFAACRTVWILHPASRVQRQERALWVAHEDYRQMRLLMSEAASGPYASRADSQTAGTAARSAAQIQTRLDDVKNAAGQIGVPFSKDDKPRDTSIIEDAVAAIDPIGDAAHGMKLLWRVNSAHAHGLGWPGLLRPAQAIVASGGDTYAQLKADPIDLANAAAAADLASNKAFALYEQRVAAPHL